MRTYALWKFDCPSHVQEWDLLSLCLSLSWLLVSSWRFLLRCFFAVMAEQNSFMVTASIGYEWFHAYWLDCSIKNLTVIMSSVEKHSFLSNLFPTQWDFVFQTSFQCQNLSIVIDAHSESFLYKLLLDYSHIASS